MGYTPDLRARFLVLAATLGVRQAGARLGLTPGQASGLWYRRNDPKRHRQPHAAPNPAAHTWDEHNLTEPWVAFRARKQAERAAANAR